MTYYIITYCTFKTQIMMENYLLNVKGLKTRIAVSKFRLSDHRLEIETGRYHRPKKKVNDRLCSVCNAVESEMHCLMTCKINKEDREKLFNVTAQRKPSFRFMDDKQRFEFLMQTNDKQLTFLIPNFIQKCLDNVDRMKQELSCSM